jgi:hypothetical protein
MFMSEDMDIAAFASFAVTEPDLCQLECVRFNKQNMSQVEAETEVETTGRDTSVTKKPL